MDFGQPFVRPFARFRLFSWREIINVPAEYQHDDDDTEQTAFSLLVLLDSNSLLCRLPCFGACRSSEELERKKQTPERETSRTGTSLFRPCGSDARQRIVVKIDKQLTRLRWPDCGPRQNRLCVRRPPAAGLRERRKCRSERTKVSGDPDLDPDEL